MVNKAEKEMELKKRKDEVEKEKKDEVEKREKTWQINRKGLKYIV